MNAPDLPTRTDRSPAPEPPTSPARATKGARTAIRDARIDPSVDLIRAVAIARVFLWHATGATGLTLIAAMPVMFFVMGSRLPSSVDRHLHADVLHRRGRRLLIPYWAYALAVVGAAALSGAIPGGASVTTSLGHLAGWLVPLSDPTIAGFGGGWLTNHLWYLRTYLWILLCLPVVGAASRRPLRSLAAGVGVIALISGPWHVHVPLVGTGTGRVLLGDLVAYGSFAVLGMVWFRHGGTTGAALGRTARRAAIGIAAVGTIATLVWLRVQGMGSSGVNGSYPAILLTGTTWLAAMAVAQPQLSRFAARPRVSWVTAMVRRRALTIYLWHPAAILVVRSLLGARAWPERPGALPMLVTVGLAAVATIAVTAVFGVIESLGQRRALAHVPRHVPHPSLASVRRSNVPALARIGAALVAFAVAVPALPGVRAAGALEAAPAAGATSASSSVATSKGRVLRAPSYREALAADAFASTVTTAPSVGGGSGAPGIATMASSGMAVRVGRAATTKRRATRPVAGATATTVRPTPTPSTALPSQAVAPSAKAPSAVAPSAIAPAAVSSSAKAPSPIASATGDGAKVAVTRTVVPTAAQLDKAVDAWFADTPGLDGAAVTVLFGDTSWSNVVRRRGSAALDPAASFLTLSITKTFTAALVLREVEKGTLSLDGALPDLPGIAERPGVTVRRLLTHESGLPDYLEVPAYNPREFLDPRSGLALSLGAPALSKPGTAVHYANSNYLWLQLLLEKVTGRSYAQLVAGLADDLHLDHTEVRPVDRTGWPGGGAGAVWSTTQDLALWLRELMTPGSVLRRATLDSMRTLDDLNMGLGLWPACPCGTDASGRKVYTGIGHHIGEGGMYFLPAVGGVVVVHSGPNGDVSILAAADLAARISALAQS